MLTASQSWVTMTVTLLMLGGCAPNTIESIRADDLSDHGPLMATASVDLRLRSGDEMPYRSVTKVDVPANHVIGDQIFPYEGIGWENKLIAYRLYLDGRFVSDIFGKQVPDQVLGQIGRHGSYHSLAPWGMDVLKVGPSLGIGGLGIMRNGQPEQFGNVPVLSARVRESGSDTASFTVAAGGIVASPGVTGSFTADYTMGTTSPMTRVSVTETGGLPLASGIVMHDGADFWQSAAKGGRWRYIATWGKQSENKDGLGLALFYRADQAGYRGLANATHYVTFDNPKFEYGFLAAWERDTMLVHSREAFTSLLDKNLAILEGTSQ